MGSVGGSHGVGVGIANTGCHFGGTGAVGHPSDPELVAAIYDAIVDPLVLREVMTLFANAMDCDAAYFKMIDQTTGEVVVGVGGGMPEGSDRDYLENYLADDVRVPRVNRARRRVIWTTAA